MYLIRPVIFQLLGTDANTYGYCSNYALWTITIGGIPTVLNRIVVSYSNQATAGQEPGKGNLRVGKNEIQAERFKDEKDMGVYYECRVIVTAFSDRVFADGAEYFGYYLLHAMMEGGYKKYGKFHLLDFVGEQKAKGLLWTESFQNL